MIKPNNTGGALMPVIQHANLKLAGGISLACYTSVAYWIGCPWLMLLRSGEPLQIINEFSNIFTQFSYKSHMKLLNILRNI